VKALIDKYAKQLDARSRRERILIFVAVAAVVFVFGYVLGIGPALDRARLASGRIAEQRNLIVVAATQKQVLERQLKEDPDEAVRQRIAERRREISGIDSQLAGLQRTLVPPESMAVMLEQLVTAGGGVRIVALRNFPAAPLLEKAAGEPAHAAAGAPTGAGPTASTAGGEPEGSQHVFKHGVEVMVEGRYLDVLAYVARLEKQTWQV
jgi:MSHA biogenesis protein MshJ